MATRAQTKRSDTQKKGLTERARKRNAARKGCAKANAKQPKKYAERSAPYAMEAPSPSGKRSRRSTRASSDHLKPDASLDLREQLQKGSPEARYRKTRAKAARVRGHAARS